MKTKLKFQKHEKTFGFAEQVFEILKIFDFQSPRFQKLKISDLPTSDRKLKVRR